jgi:hypothetical protein
VSARPNGNLPAMTRGRPSDYTEAEDAIILKVIDTKECQRLLKEAGFPERTPAAIWSRRDYLRRTGATVADMEGLPEEEEGRILFARRAKLQERLRSLDAQREELQSEIDELTERLRGLL